MHRRLTRVCIPFLAILVLAWGSCPCFYAEILTGGLIQFDMASADGCICSVETNDGCTDDELAASTNGTPPNSGCPCVGTVGTMHELPQVEDDGLAAGNDICLVSAPLTLRDPASPADHENPDVPADADPGPQLRSVVLLV